MSGFSDKKATIGSRTHVPQPAAGPRLNEEMWVWLEEQLIAAADGGRTKTSIAQEATAVYRVTDRTVWEYFAKIQGTWRDRSAASLEDRRAEYLAKIGADIRDARADRNHSAIAQLRKCEAKVSGVEAPREIKVTGGLRPIEAMTPEERRAELEELRQRREETGKEE